MMVQVVLCGLISFSGICFGMKEEWKIDRISHQEENGQLYVGTGTVHIAYKQKTKSKEPDFSVDWTPDVRSRMNAPMMIVFKNFTAANYKEIQNVKKDHSMYVYKTNSLSMKPYVGIIEIEEPFHVIKRWNDCITLGSENEDSITIYDSKNIQKIDEACHNRMGEFFIMLTRQDRIVEIGKIKKANKCGGVNLINFLSKIGNFSSSKDWNSFLSQFVISIQVRTIHANEDNFENITIDLDEDAKSWRWYAACKGMRWGLFAAIMLYVGKKMYDVGYNFSRTH